MNEPSVLIRKLENLRGRDDRASLASLRRGLGQPPGAVPETTRIVEHMLDEDDRDSTRNALYIVAPLFAFHPLSEGEDRWSNMGSHFRALIGDSAEPPANVERRFMAVMSSEPDDLPDTLRQAISLLKSRSVPVNWRNLFVDVQCLLDSRPEGEQKRQDVRLRWSRNFWRLPKHVAATTTAETQTQINP